MPCRCGYDDHHVPTTRAEILEAAGLRNEIDALLEPVAVDSGKWMRVMRCTVCGRYWAEDSIDSGHATLTFAYPIDTDDPDGWLATAHSVWA